MGLITGGTPAPGDAIVTFPHERGAQSDFKRSVIVAVTGIVSDIVSLIAEISTHGQELHLWSVIRVFGEHLKSVV